MLQQKNPEASSVKRRKVLLACPQTAVQSLVSTLLLTMGWSCVVVPTKEELPDILEREAFDVVVIDLGRSEAEAEQVILKIKQIRPTVGSRIVAINGGVVDRDMLELLERHEVIHLSQEAILPQLWTTLQQLFTSRPLWHAALRSTGIPRLIFDSLRSPQAANVRGSSTSSRQLAYEVKRTVIDLSIELPEGSRRTSIAGQVLDGEKKIMTEGLSVLLACSAGTLARTTTNQFGEFHLEFESGEPLSLQIRLGEGMWIFISLGKMNWAGNRSPSPPGKS